MMTSRRLSLLFLMLALPAKAAFVSIGLTNFGFFAATNDVVVFMAGPNVLSDGSFIHVGNGLRIPTGTNGYVVTNLLAGVYDLTVVNLTLPSTVLFAVPQDSSTNIYPVMPGLGGIMISGGNTYNFVPQTSLFAGTGGVFVTQIGLSNRIDIAPSGVTSSLIFNSVAALKAWSTASLINGQTAILTGYYVAGDKGGGTFTWNSASVLADDQGFILIPNSNPASGRWVRTFATTERPNIRMWGAKGDIDFNSPATDDTIAIRNALHAFENPNFATLGNNLVIPSGHFLISNTIYFSGEINIIGDNCTYSKIAMSNSVSKDMFITYSASNSLAGVATYQGFANYDNGLRVSGVTFEYAGTNNVTLTNALFSIGRWEEHTRFDNCAFIGGGYGLRCFGIGNPGVQLHHINMVKAAIAEIFITQDYAGELGDIAGGPVNLEEISGDNILDAFQTNASFIVLTNVFGTVRIADFKAEGAFPKGLIRWDTSIGLGGTTNAGTYTQEVNSPMCALHVENVYWNEAGVETPLTNQFLAGRDLIEFGGGGQRSPSLYLQGVQISGITNLIRDNVTGRNVTPEGLLGTALSQQAVRIPIFYQSASNSIFATNGVTPTDEILYSRLVVGDTEVYTFTPASNGWYRVMRGNDGSLSDNANLAGNISIKVYPHFDDTELHFAINSYATNAIAWNVVRPTSTNTANLSLCASPRVDQARAFYYNDGSIVVGYLDIHVQQTTNCLGVNTPITIVHPLRGDGDDPNSTTMQLLSPVAASSVTLPGGSTSKVIPLLDDGSGNVYLNHGFGAVLVGTTGTNNQLTNATFITAPGASTAFFHAGQATPDAVNSTAGWTFPLGFTSGSNITLNGGVFIGNGAGITNLDSSGINLTNDQVSIIVLTNGAITGPWGAISSAGSLTMGIQEALNATPVFGSNLPGGIEIELGPGIFYLQTNLYTKGLTNVNSVKIHGQGIQSTAVVQLTNAENWLVDATYSGQLITYDARDMTWATMSQLTTNILHFNCATSGLSRGSIVNCGFGTWINLTNTGPGLGLPTKGWFTYSTASPNSTSNNDICPIFVNSGPSDQFSVEHCSFYAVGTAVFAMPNGPVLRDNSFQFCGATTANPTNDWPKGDPRYVGAAIYIGEQIPYQGVNLGGKFMDVRHNEFVSCSVIGMIKDGLSGSYTWYNSIIEGVTTPSFVIDDLFSAGGTTRGTITMVDTRGAGSGFPPTFNCFMVTNSNDYSTWTSNQVTTNLFTINTQTNGVQMTGDLLARNLYANGKMNIGGSVTSTVWADRIGFELTTPVGTVGGSGSRFSGRGSSLAGLPQVPDQLNRAAPVPPLYYTMAIDYGSHGTAANVTNKAYWISTNGMQAAGYKWITSYGWNQTNRFNGHMIINDTEFTQITNSVTITNPVGVATAIAWTTSPNPYHTGSYITIAGASPSYLNGTFKVTVTNSSSFYYAISSSAAVNTSGTANDNGIQRVCDFCHSLGFKFGIYTTYSADGETNVVGAPAGTTQCIDAGCNGTAGTPPNSIYTDILDFQSWGVDMVEVDACNVSYTYEQEYELKRQWAEAVLTARVLGQNGVYGNTNQMFLWATVFKNGEDTDEIDCFNNMEDGQDYIQSTASNVVYSATKRWQLDNARIRPGHYAEVGWVNLDSGQGSDFSTFQQSVPTAMSQYSMDTMLASPIGTGTNLFTHLFIFTNQWVNAIQQDSAVIPGSMTASNSNVEVWARPLGARNSGTNAVCVVNWNTYTTNFSIFDTNCGLPPNSRFTVKDVWAQTNMGTFVNSFPVNATNGDTRLLIVSQVAQVLPVFSPANVPGLALWWDGDQATNKINGTTVKIVPDLSTNAFHGIALGGNCYWTSNPSMLNGRGWIQSDQSVQTAHISTNFGIFAPTNDIFFVGNIVGPINHYLMDGATNNSGEQILFLTGNVLDLAAPSNVGTSAGISPNEMAVYEFRYTGGVGAFISVNGVQIASGNAGALNQLGINFGSAFDGSLSVTWGMAQFLEYNRDLSTGDRNYVINGLMRQFNLPGATLVFTNWIPGALYTNISGGDWLVAATVSKELAASVGIAEIDLQVDETQSGTLNTRAASRETSLATGVVHTNQSQVSAIVPNGGRFTFTNNDTVEVSRIVAGSGFYRQIK